MKTILLSAFLFVIGSGVALAQDGPFVQHPEAEDFWASELLGANVHVTETEIDDATIDTAPEGWEVVANISELVISRDGTIRGVLLDVGGFLGIGARTVMVSMDALRFVERSDTGEVFVVFTASREQLEAAPEYDDTPRVERREAAAQEPAAATPVQPAEPAAPAADPAARPADQDRLGVREPGEGWERVELATLTVNDLTNAVVYDRFDERVSGIHDVLLSADGTTVEAVLIDVGGFLGIGARTVAVPIDMIDILYDPQTDDVRVYLAMTEQELEAQPEYRR
jgi:hypothetical protein